MLAILGVMLSLILPAIQRVREVANRAKCASNMRQISVAVHHLHNDLNYLAQSQVGPFVPQPGQINYGWGPDSKGWSWLARILPYIEHDTLFTQGGIPDKTLRQSGICDRRIPLFLCPSDMAYYADARLDAGNLDGFAVGLTNYKGVSGANWGFDKGEGKPLFTFWPNKGVNGSFDGQDEGDGILLRSGIRHRLHVTHIRDGLSNTFLIGEVIPSKDRWCSWPYANNAHGTCAIPPNARNPITGAEFDPLKWHNNLGFRSSHPGGLQFAFADTSVRFVRNTIDLNIYRAFATINGGEPVSPANLDD